MPPTDASCASNLSHDCLIGDDHLDALIHPIVVDTQRAAALRLGDRRVLALMQTLCFFALNPTGFRPAASLPTAGTHPGPQVMERLDAALTKFLQEVRLVA